MKISKEIYGQFLAGVLLACIYGFFKLEHSNSYAFISAVKDFESARTQKLEISLINSSGQKIYVYSDSKDFERNQRLINLLSESKVIDRNVDSEYCLHTLIAEDEFNGCFNAREANKNLPLAVLLKILSLNNEML